MTDSTKQGNPETKQGSI